MTTGKGALRMALFGVVFILMRGSFSVSKENWIVYLRHTGPLQIGMSISEVRKVIGDPSAHLVWLDQSDPKGINECSYLETRALPVGLNVMFNRQRVVRIEITEKNATKTASGIGIGDTEEKAKAAYPNRIRVEPHPYTDGHYLVFTPADKADRDYGMIFETEQGRVTEFRAGLMNAVILIEGCA